MFLFEGCHAFQHSQRLQAGTMLAFYQTPDDRLVSRGRLSGTLPAGWLAGWLAGWVVECWAMPEACRASECHPSPIHAVDVWALALTGGSSGVARVAVHLSTSQPLCLRPQDPAPQRPDASGCSQWWPPAVPRCLHRPARLFSGISIAWGPAPPRACPSRRPCQPLHPMTQQPPA